MSRQLVECFQMDNCHCNLCGGMFDEGGTCSKGMHEIGEFYPMDVQDPADGTEVSVAITKGSSRAICIPVEGSLCSICMQSFQGGDICPNKHKIGEWYEKKR
jgi:hypothetical protein